MKKNKKEIWLWNHYATNMYKREGGRHYWFAENLKKAGYDVKIFCANTFSISNEKIDTGKEKYTVKIKNGIPFVFVKTSPASGNGLDRIKNMVLFYKNLIPVAKKIAKTYGKPDLIIASSVHPLTMVAGIKVAKKMNIPCICEIRDLWPEAIFAHEKISEKSLLGRAMIKGEHWIYSKADALIFTKEGDTDYLKEQKWDKDQGGTIDLKKAHYINNGIDILEFERLVEDEKVEDQDLNSDLFSVVYSGTLGPVNDVGKLLEAAHFLKDYPDIQLLIYGAGNQSEMLEQKVQDEDLWNVKMKGYVDKQQIPYILSRSSINILNYSQTQYNWSRGNSSNKLFEYMASGKPVISTIKMGYSIIDKYKCGIEIENATPKEIAEAVLKIKNLSPANYQKLGDNAKAGAKEFDFNVLTKKLIAVIESVDTKY